MENRTFTLLKTALALLIALASACVIIFWASAAPLDALYSLFIGPFTSLRRFGNIIEAMTPLIFTGLAVILLYRAGLFNLSMEGGFFIASVVATASALLLPLPPVINIIAAVLLAALAGGVASLIPGILKVQCKAPELVTSLMLNYVLLYLGLYIIINHLSDPSMNANYSYPFPENMALPRILDGTRVNAGSIVALLAVGLVYVFLNKTVFGYNVTLVGQNRRLAHASGIRVGRTVLASQMLGGALAGLGGAMELFGMYKRFQYQGLPGFGWDGVLIAIVARFRPELIPLSSFFLAYLRIGTDIMSRESDIPSEIITIIQATVIVLISAEALLKNYRHRQIVRRAMREGAKNA